MTEPAEIKAGERTITLGNKVWPIPQLAVRQLRTIRGPLIEMNKRLSKGGFDSLDEAEYDKLMLTPIYTALLRAHPKMEREEFDEMSTSETEIILAWMTVRDASGVFVSGSGAGAASAGEAQAGEQASQTGT